ncbi:MAG: hypothetical protein RL701_4759 [Pseudomonadota bacterium]|jgi:nucleotide-binding universal stress UspA family protein
MRFKQILVPVDFSAASALALEEAGTLAKKFDAAIDLLHVWDFPALVGPQEVYIGAALPPTVLQTVKENAENAITSCAARARERGLPVRHARAVAGTAYEVIVEEAKSGAYDLVVIGTHGRKLVSRWLLGSVAERVVRHASCPVLVARPQPGDEVTAPQSA